MLHTFSVDLVHLYQFIVYKYGKKKVMLFIRVQFDNEKLAIAMAVI